ncbi:MAG: 2-amino-4-hydroxy-6-hydroxymethyldihydropteridine diphosphokinase [Candidatus Eisenbacteria sp.]|nr:2-amino-4-hydroxy-6-hydroxymethyldihydropteridine diphosphokinase [Candidatus Eisenbacteria bacterium]
MVRAGTEPVYVGVGSNQANRNENIALALLMLEADSRIRVKVCSQAYLTEPVSEIPQPTFVNAVVELETSCEPASLLGKLKEIETLLGRTAGRRWGPRAIDLDILFFGKRIVREPELRVPHPRLEERHFVLYPLTEIAPAFIHPVSGLTVTELKRRLPRIGCPPRCVRWGRVPRWSTVSSATP